MPCQKHREFPGVSHPGRNRGDRRGAYDRVGPERQEPVAALAGGGLARRAKGEAGKESLAARLRAETVMTVQSDAERLGLGTPGYGHLRVSRQRQPI